MKLTLRGFLLSAFCLLVAVTECSSSLISDRAAVERVYYRHRLATTQPFEEVFPDNVLNDLVQKDLLKERILANRYGIRVTEEQLIQEARRIETATRAPEVLGELRMALGNDPQRFAETVVRPIIVERLLRKQFQNDAALHGQGRITAGDIRDSLTGIRQSGYDSQLKALKNSGYSVSETCFLLSTATDDGTVSSNSQGWSVTSKGNTKGGPYRIESEIQVTAPTDHVEEPEFRFADLHPDLQAVLDIQLIDTGDVSAVIEQPDGFHLYLLKKRTREQMQVAILTLPKLNYDAWLTSQKD